VQGRVGTPWRASPWLFAGIVGTALWALPAPGQLTCPGGGMNTVANCDGDTCSCASPCNSASECNSRCCIEGYCALACACQDGGVVDRTCTSPEDLPTGSGCRSGAAPGGAAAAMLGISRRRRKARKLLQ